MNLIHQEQELAGKKLFSTFYNQAGQELVQITRDNVAIAEAMLFNDSSFIRMVDREAKPDEGFDKKNTLYQGSSAFWFTRLAEVYKEPRNYKNNRKAAQIIQFAVNAVDRENSTHLNADGVGREQISDRIFSEYQNGDLLELLKNDNGKYELFKLIEKRTELPEGAKKNGRVNTSFASKFCHYAAFFLFEEEKEQDNYSIWDSVLCKSLPLYFDFYGIDNYNLMDYQSYQDAIDLIRNKAKESNELISRNGFDHLIWYFFKGRINTARYKAKR